MLFGNGGSNGGSKPGALVIGLEQTQALPFDGALEVIDARVEEEGFGVPGAERFPDQAWDPALRAQLILAELSTTDWYVNALDKVETDTDLKPASLKDGNVAEGLINDLVRLRNRYRGSRAEEIALQADNAGAYWSQLLMLSPGNRPYTGTLVATGFAVGQTVGMVFKNGYGRARPVQVFPALMPAIPTPSHPSYPSNHALQSHLVGRLVTAVLPGKENNPMAPAIAALSTRIGKNREIAGVHFEDDTDAGVAIADWIFDTYLAHLPAVTAVMEGAQKEWADLRSSSSETMIISGHRDPGPLIERITMNMRRVIRETLERSSEDLPTPSGS